MNASVKQMLEAHEQQVRKETILRVINKLTQRTTQYDHLLYNETAHNIFMNTYGERFGRLVYKRGALIKKLHVTKEIIGAIFAEMN